MANYDAPIFKLPVQGSGFHSKTGGFEFILIGGSKYDRPTVINALAFYEQIKAALGTCEDGADLVDIARNAHRAEQELAALKRKFPTSFLKFKKMLKD